MQGLVGAVRAVDASVAAPRQRHTLHGASRVAVAAAALELLAAAAQHRLLLERLHVVAGIQVRGDGGHCDIDIVH